MMFTEWSQKCLKKIIETVIEQKHDKNTEIPSDPNFSAEFLLLIRGNRMRKKKQKPKRKSQSSCLTKSSFDERFVGWLVCRLV